jgi:hypothetical protein
MRYLFVASIACALVLGATSVCFAKHPADGYPIAGHWVEGAKFPDSSLSIGDLTFMPESEYPDYSKLTQLEQYMMFGVTSSDLSSHDGLPPYRSTILGWVCRCYEELGYIPDQLTPDVVRTLPGYENMKDEWLSIERNPLTGAWPKLTSVRHSPGDFCFRVLTDDEINFFVSNGFQELRHPYSPDGGYIERYTPVFYVRMYGYDGVLGNGFSYLSH